MPLLVFLSCLLITLSTKFRSDNGLLSNGILADLLITAPLLYFLAIRKSSVSSFSTTRVFILGLLFAGIILKSGSNPILHIIQRWVSPVIEASIIFMIGRKFYLANKKAKETSNTKIDFLFHCRKVMFQVIGNEKISTLISSEIAVLYYTFFGSRDKTIDYKITFSIYKDNGITLVLGVILSILLIETAGVHFLLMLWNKTIAWTLTGLSVYTCIQLFAHIRAIKARPIILNADSIEIHNGLAGDAFIQVENIEKIEISSKNPGNRESIKISLLQGLENHNIVVYLKKPIEVTKIFGIKKQAIPFCFLLTNQKNLSLS